MVILYVSHNYKKKGKTFTGGASVYINRVAGALRKFGHTPIILSSGTQDMHYIEDGVEVFFVREPRLRLKTDYLKEPVNSLCSSFAVNRKISELVRTRKIDLIQFSSIQSVALLYHGKIPAVMRLSSYDKLYDRDFPNKVIANICASMQRLAAQRCTMVFAPSYVIANAFAKDIHRRVAVLESPFWNECSEYDDSVYLSKLKGKKYVLFFGRLTIIKGVLVIADLLEQFLQLHEEYYFVCCGIEQSGKKENLVRSLQRGAGKHRERFLYIEALPHSLLYPIVKQADFVICPSYIENLSNTCMEAMYFERVVIGTDGASYEQLINDGENGLLCMPEDSGSLLGKMNQAAAMDEAQKEEMGKKARQRIDRLAPEIMIRKLEQLYQYVIEHTKR
ncbi:MAG: glycosyltransferase family 4 protein [Lachnospiraceae bacterium]|nr:glycosyltransferase family 4 protein [Lachnospiraceae bacterium]